MRIPRILPPLLLAILLLPGVQAYTDTPTGTSCSQATTMPADAALATSTSCRDGAICLPVYLEVDPPWVTPVLRPECIQQTIQNVRELIGI